MQNLFKVAIICMYFLFSLNGIGQSKNDLLKQAETAKDYKKQIEAYYKLGDIAFETNYDSAKFYYNKGYQIALKNNDLNEQHSYYSNIGNIYTYEGKHPELIKAMKAALAIAEKIGDKEKIAKSTANIGVAIINNGKYKEGVEYFQKASKLFAENNQPNIERKVDLMIATTYHNANEFDKSMAYSQKVLEKATIAKDSVVIAEANQNIGDCYIEKDEELKAEPYVKIAFELFSKLKIDSKISNSLLALSKISFKKNYVNEAIIYAEKALKSYEKQGNEFYRINALTYLADYYSAKNETNKAVEYLKTAESIAINNDFKQHFPLIYEAQVKNYRKLNDFKNAFFAYEKFQNHNDSLISKDVKIQLQDLDVKYQTEKRKNQINQLETDKKRQNTLIYSLIAGLLAVSVIGFIGYRNIKIRKEIAEKEIIQLQQEKQLTATESIIKGQEEERSRLAKDLHDGLGGLLSGIKYTLNTMTGNVILSEQNANVFTRALGQLDNAISEMRRVAHSMMPEALLKFGLNDALRDFCEGISQSGKLKVHFQSYGIENRLNQSTEITIYRIVQELLNNTMKHAEATDAYVQLTKAENLLTLTVEDNGKGFDINNLAKNKGVGISNIESRVAYLNGKMDIQSNEREGTSFNVEFPI
jgi:two-component system, NarL family, sensor kinase